MNKKEALKILESAIEEYDSNCDGQHIVVLDNGWVFHGNLLRNSDGSFILTSCVNILKWSEVGFGGLTKGALNAKLYLTTQSL